MWPVDKKKKITCNSVVGKHYIAKTSQYVKVTKKGITTKKNNEEMRSKINGEIEK